MSDIKPSPVKSTYGRGGGRGGGKGGGRGGREIVLTNHGQDRYRNRRAHP